MKVKDLLVSSPRVRQNLPLLTEMVSKRSEYFCDCEGHLCIREEAIDLVCMALDPMYVRGKFSSGVREYKDIKCHFEAERISRVSFGSKQELSRLSDLREFYLDQIIEIECAMEKLYDAVVMDLYVLYKK